MHLHLAREDDLVQRPRPDALDRAGHGGLVVLGRHRADHAVAPGRIGVQQRQRRAAQLRSALDEPGTERLGVVVGGGDRGQRERHLLAAARQRDLGQVQRRGLEAGPRRRRAAIGSEGEAADRHRPRVLARRVGQELAPARGDASEAPGAARVERGGATDRGQGEAVAVGVLEAEPVLARAARGDGHRGRVHRGRERHRDRHQALARAPRAAHALAGARAQTLAVAVAQQRAAHGVQERAGHAGSLGGRSGHRAALRWPGAMVFLGILLLGAGAGLLIAEAHLPSYGALGLAGVVALAIGAALAVNGAGGGAVLIVAIVLIVALAALALLALIARATLTAARGRPKTGVEGLVGHVGVIRSAPAPVGQVFIDGALWRARPCLEDDLVVGDPVVVERVNGLVLSVRRAEEWEVDP